MSAEPGTSATATRVAAPIRVVAADDSLLIREGLRSLLAAFPQIELVAQAGDLEGLLAAVERHRPDVVLTDLRMPPSHTDEGVRAAKALRDSHPGTGVVVLSQHLDPGQAMELLRSGSASRGYLLKDRLGDPVVLLPAVRDVAEGRSCVDPAVVDALVGAPTGGMGPGTGDGHGPQNPGLGSLTPREREILGLVAQGASNAAVADRLVISKGAVEKHINAIFAKLGLDHDAAASRRVLAVLAYLGG